MSTTTIRWTVTKQLVDLLRAHPDLAGVSIDSGWPGDSQKAESIWVEQLSGTETVPVMNGGARVITDDRFEIPLQMRVANRKNNDATMLRLEEMRGAVQDVLKDDPSLGLTDFSMFEADLGESETLAGPTKEGVQGFGRMTISVYARLF